MSEIFDRLRGYADSRLYALPGQYVCDVPEILNEHAALITRLTTAARERDEARREREAWEETAAMFSRNEAFYRDLIDTTARSLGTEAFTDDTGAVHDSPLRLKVPELVEALRHRAEQAERERDQFASMLHDCENERDGWKHRAERAEAEASYIRRAFRGAIESDALAVTYRTVGSYRAGLLKTINALDTTPTPEARDARGDA